MTRCRHRRLRLRDEVRAAVYLWNNCPFEPHHEPEIESPALDAAPPMLSRASNKPPESPRASTPISGVVKSPWSLDLGGAQRSELAARNEALAEELRLKDSQILVLRQLQKSSAKDGRIERWRTLTVAPVFSSWRCAVATWKAERLLEAERGARAAAASEAARAVEAKDAQLVALADRVARVKANAQAKLAELSSANRQLAAALEQKDQALLDAEARAKHLTRTAGAQGEREVELQLRIEQLADALGKTEHEAGRSARALAGYQREAADLRAKAAVAAESLAEERATSLATRSELCSVRRELEAQHGVSTRLWARAEGLEAEAACLKAEAAAQRALFRIEVRGRRTTNSRSGAPVRRAPGTAAPSGGCVPCRDPGSATGSSPRPAAPGAGGGDLRSLGGEDVRDPNARTGGRYDCATAGNGSLESVLAAGELDGAHRAEDEEEWQQRVLGLQLASWQRALLSACFHGWSSRVLWSRRLREEREMHALIVQLPVGQQLSELDSSNLGAAAGVGLASCPISSGGGGVGDGGVDACGGSVLIGRVMHSVLAAEEARVRAELAPREARVAADAAALASALADADTDQAQLAAFAATQAAELKREFQLRLRLGAQLAQSAAALAEDEARTLALLDRQRAAREALLGPEGLDGRLSAAGSGTALAPGCFPARYIWGTDLGSGVVSLTTAPPGAAAHAQLSQAVRTALRGGPSSPRGLFAPTQLVVEDEPEPPGAGMASLIGMAGPEQCAPEPRASDGAQLPGAGLPEPDRPPPKPPGPAAPPAVATTTCCATCNSVLPRRQFSASQLKKPVSQQRCKACVAQAERDGGHVVGSDEVDLAGRTRSPPGVPAPVPPGNQAATS